MADTFQEVAMTMTSELALAVSEPSQRADHAREQIKRLVGERLRGRRIDGVTFVEELLAIVTQVGELSCTRVADTGLLFQLPGIDPFEVELDGNRGKLRMLCARLAVLCHESGHEMLLYGGEGTICRTAKIDACDRESDPILYFLVWKARWSNTPDKHDFTLSVSR